MCAFRTACIARRLSRWVAASGSSPGETIRTGGSCFFPAITTPPQLRRRLGRVRPPEVKSFMARNAARSVAVHVCAVGDAREHATGHDQLVRVIMGIGPLKRPPAAVD